MGTRGGPSLRYRAIGVIGNVVGDDMKLKNFVAGTFASLCGTLAVGEADWVLRGGVNDSTKVHQLFSDERLVHTRSTR